ncbi:MAG: hypothetical protein IT198_09085 [Acidimicrobiia bacterium]|nr:hypothetical protein [Acidimicrobiia bacterium]
MHLVLLGDSTAFHNHRERLPLDDSRLYQNVAADRITALTGDKVRVTALVRAGQCTPDVWQLVSKDIWTQSEILPRADVVVLNFAGGDMLPVGVPTWLKDLIPRVPQPELRRRLRRLYWDRHADLVRLTRGRMRTVPRSVSLELWPRIVDLSRFYSQAPVLSLTCQPVRAAHHGSLDPHSREHTDDLIAMAEAKGVPYLDHYPLAEKALDDLNPVDGMHWPDYMHEEVGIRLADLVLEQLSPELGT